MKTFEQTLEEIQNAINSIKDDEIRQKAQNQFNLVPREKSLYSIRSHSDVIGRDEISANLSPREIVGEYARRKAEREMEHYVGKGQYTIDEKYKSEYHIPETNDKTLPEDYYMHDDPHDNIAEDVTGGWKLGIDDVSDDQKMRFKYTITNNNGNVIDSQVVTEDDAAFDMYYKGHVDKEIEKKNPDQFDLSTAKKRIEAKLGSHKSYNGNCNSFTVDSTTLDESAGHYFEGENFNKAERIDTEGVVKRRETFSFDSASGKGRIPSQEEIRESMEELGIDKNLEKYVSRESNITDIIDGKITEIDRERSVESGNTTKTQKDKVTLDNESGFTKETDKKIETQVDKSVEKGVLKPDQKLSLDVVGEQQNLRETPGGMVQGAV